jgi:hypothetical protein
MRARLPVRAVAIAALLGSGCVTSRVFTNEPDARVYVDGRRLAPGQRFWAIGPPHRAEVRVVAPDGREARARMRRQFGFGTALLGFYSLGTCWALCWTYPDELTVLLPPPAAPTWDAAPGADPWTRPPPAWSPPAAPAPPLAPAADPWGAPPGS